jgi:hypothetical protein
MTMEMLGHHVILDLWGLPSELLDDVRALERCSVCTRLHSSGGLGNEAITS